MHRGAQPRRRRRAPGSRPRDVRSGHDLRLRRGGPAPIGAPADRARGHSRTRPLGTPPDDRPADGEALGSRPRRRGGRAHRRDARRSAPDGRPQRRRRRGAEPVGHERLADVPLRPAGDVPLRRLLPLALVLLALAVRVVPAALFGTEAADLATYRDMALTVSRGDDVYSRSIYFPYTPHSQFLPALALALSEKTRIPFALAMRLESILADAATTWLLFAGLLAEGASRRRAGLAALSFALNPVAILVSAFHGNLMSLVAFLLLAALVTARASVRAAGAAEGAALRASSALLFGLAIAMRSFPILMLPFLLVLAARTARRPLAYTALAASASVLSTVPYLLLDRTPFLREVLAYSGAGDFGRLAALLWSAVWKGEELPAIWTMLPATKPLFLLAYVLALAAHLVLRRDPSRGLLLAPLLFYAVYGGVASQDLVLGRH